MKLARKVLPASVIVVASVLLLLGDVTARHLAHSEHTPVALCLSVKDEHKDLREWVDYHREIGVSKFYIFDNNSSVPLLSVLTDYIQQELVQYHYLIGKSLAHPQFDVYNKCLQLYRSFHTWMGFIDTDEFIVIPSGLPIADVLQPYTAYGGLVLNWRQIGSTGHLTRPAGGVLANYFKCFAEDDENNKHVKSLVVTAHARASNGAHFFKYAPGFSAVNVRFEPVDGPFSSPPDFTQIFLYHYVTRSKEDYQAKMVRGSGAGRHKPASYFDAVNALSTANCSLLLNWGDRARTRAKQTVRRLSL